jgi:hypothetical protein
VAAPVLKPFDPMLETELATDATDLALGAVLSQKQVDGKWHPVMYHSRKFIHRGPSV